MTRDEAIAFRRKIEQASAWTDDADALEMVEFFPLWRSGASYIAGERAQYDGVLFKCVQAHTSQIDWNPDITPALWVLVSVEEWHDWVQPQGAADAYMKGEKVAHNDKHWICDSNYNVSAPGVWGWTEVSDE